MNLEAPPFGRGIVVVLLLTALALCSALPDAGWVLDDHRRLAMDPAGTSLISRLGEEFTRPTYDHGSAAVRSAVWRPLPMVAQLIVGELFGRTPLVFRTFNLMLHLGVTLSAATLTARLLQTAQRSWAPLGVGVVVGLHPIVTEAVCWPSGIFDVGLALVVLGGTLGLLGRAGGARGVLLGATLGLVAPLCKESGLAVLPALFLLLVARDGVRASLYFGAGAGLGAGLWWAWAGLVNGGAMAEVAASATPLAVLVALLLELRWFVFPWGDAPFSHELTLGAASWGPGLGLVSVGLLGLWRGLGAGGRGRVVLVTAAILLLLLPGAVAIAAGQLAPHRFAYVALVVGAPWWVWGLGATNEAIERRFFVPPFVPLLWAPVLLVVGLGLPFTVSRAIAWRTETSLFADELAREPEAPFARVHAARLDFLASPDRARLLSWFVAIRGVSEGVRVVSPVQARWQLAQAAFLSENPDVALDALDEIDTLSAQQRVPAPALAGCLRADVLDRLGRHAEAEAVAAARCTGG